MIIERIDSDRDVNKKAERVVLVVGGKRITLTEVGGELNIHADCDDLMVSCGSRNALSLIPSDRG